MGDQPMRRTWPPWVWPLRVSDTRGGICVNRSGSWAKWMMGASSVILRKGAGEIVTAFEAAADFRLYGHNACGA